MEDTWESNVSPLMMGVGMGDLRGMGELQPSCSGQDMNRDMNHQNMPQHQPHPSDMSQDMTANMQDLDQDLGRDLNHDMHHHQGSMNHNEYYTNQAS